MRRTGVRDFGRKAANPPGLWGIRGLGDRSVPSAGISEAFSSAHARDGKRRPARDPLPRRRGECPMCAAGSYRWTTDGRGAGPFTGFYKTRSGLVLDDLPCDGDYIPRSWARASSAAPASSAARNAMGRCSSRRALCFLSNALGEAVFRAPAHHFLHGALLMVGDGRRQVEGLAVEVHVEGKFEIGPSSWRSALIRRVCRPSAMAS
jgi:hypothetical protein